MFLFFSVAEKKLIRSTKNSSRSESRREKKGLWLNVVIFLRQPLEGSAAQPRWLSFSTLGTVVTVPSNHSCVQDLFASCASSDSPITCPVTILNCGSHHKVSFVIKFCLISSKACAFFKSRTHNMSNRL